MAGSRPRRRQPVRGGRVHRPVAAEDRCRRLNGWDPLLQQGLPTPTLSWLDEVAPDQAYFNSRADLRAGLTPDTADPRGARYGRDANSDLDGSAEESGTVVLEAEDLEVHATFLAGRQVYPS